MAKTKTPAKDRYKQYVVRSSDPNACWNWSASVFPSGYPALWGDTNIMLTGHVFSYELHKGPVPKGMCVCHTCDNRICTNPNHLFLGTRHDNNLDMFKKDRANRKLSHQQVNEIKVARANGTSAKSLATLYGVTTTTISNITSGRTHSYVTP